MLYYPRYNVSQGSAPRFCLQVGKDPAGAFGSQSESNAREQEEEEKFLRCIVCQATITRQSDRITINERHQHVFTNPHGYIFQIGCFAVAQGCVFSDNESNFFSWFPGYAWRFALCGQCLTHLGWGFRSQDSQFVGLILDKLLMQ
ncbi:MAG: hypothetical protein GY801_26205 [bacterium]|nr:hypothetical protein [bacterium]